LLTRAQQWVRHYPSCMFPCQRFNIPPTPIFLLAHHSAKHAVPTVHVRSPLIPCGSHMARVNHTDTPVYQALANRELSLFLKLFILIINISGVAQYEWISQGIFVGWGASVNNSVTRMWLGHDTDEI
jgi:hypothetical protein